MENIERTKTTKYLITTLTEEDKKKIASTMADSFQAISQLEANLKSTSTQLKAKITEHQARLIEASDKYRSGFEMRNIECWIEKDFRVGRVYITRIDTGEIIEERAMDGEERQRSLEFNAKEADLKAAQPTSEIPDEAEEAITQDENAQIEKQMEAEEPSDNPWETFEEEPKDLPEDNNDFYNKNGKYAGGSK